MKTVTIALIGGGSLIRMGCHPLSGVLWLKQVEAQTKAEKLLFKNSGNESVTFDLESRLDARYMTRRRYNEKDSYAARN